MSCLTTTQLELTQDATALETVDRPFYTTTSYFSVRHKAPTGPYSPHLGELVAAPGLHTPYVSIYLSLVSSRS